MQLLNATQMQAGYTLGIDPAGRERIVVVVKGTFMFPKKPDVESELAEEQVPLVTADQFTGEPGLSAPVYEADFPPYKPRCDVLLNGSAYAPAGRSLTTVTVAVQVGPMSKSFHVIGDRVWEKGITGVTAGAPRRFEVMPLSYDRAFGGSHPSERDPDLMDAFMPNPVGKGYYAGRDRNAVGQSLPNTEELRRPISKPDAHYTPMSFGPIGRSWEPRFRFGGTYDQDWVDNVFPFLPADFDDRYYQAASADQQIPHLQGEEEVVLSNLTQRGRTAFRIPKMKMPVTFYLKSCERKETVAVIDTLMIEPDLARFILIWRVSLPLRRNIFEVGEAVAGNMPRAWYRARSSTKTWYPSLGGLVEARRRERNEAQETEEA
jgi:hypothetical protein